MSTQSDCKFCRTTPNAGDPSCCQTLEQAYEQTSERPYGCPWFDQEDRKRNPKSAVPEAVRDAQSGDVHAVSDCTRWRMNVDFTEVAKLIGELMAAATHDLKTANPGDVGLDGVSIRAWRSAYAEGCKDMANKVVSKFPEDQYAEIKTAVMASFRSEFARLEASTLSPPEFDSIQAAIDADNGGQP